MYCTLYVEFESDSGTGLCGCSVFRRDAALTAAHCFARLDPVDGRGVEYFKAARVRLYGAARTPDGGLARVPNGEVIIHPDHSAYTLENDIAFFSLPDGGALVDEVILNEDATRWDALTEKDKLKVVGVGRDRFGAYSLGGPPKETYLSRRDCKNPTGPGGLIGWPHYSAYLEDICAGPYEACEEEWCSDSCSGDSGGPLFAEVNASVILYGIVSRGDTECGRKGGYPGIYTALHEHAGFIAQSLEGKPYDSSYLGAHNSEQHKNGVGRLCRRSILIYTGALFILLQT